MLKRLALHLTSGLLVLSAGFPVAAQTFSLNVSQCFNDGKAFSVDMQIGGCTEALGYASILDSGQPAFRVMVYISRGIAHQAKGNHDRAIADFSEAIRSDRTHRLCWFAYVNRGEAHTDRADYDHAIGDYNEAINLNPKFAESYSKRGIAYERKRDYVRAIADFRQALSRNPNDQSSSEALERLGAKP